MIDFHVHAEAYNWQDMELMSLAGIKAVISCTYYPHMMEITTRRIEEFYERQKKLTGWLLSMNYIKLFIACGVNPMSVPIDYSDFIDKIPGYLEGDDSFVAIGEVGLDHRSTTCQDLEVQADILSRELIIGKEAGVPVIIHTPPESVESGLQGDWLDAGGRAQEIIERDLEIVEETGIDPKLVVIDHLSSHEMVKKVTDFGAFAGLTVQPWRNVTAAQVVSLMKDCDASKILVSSDSGPLRSDCLGVPRIALEMRRANFPDEIIRQITLENPVSLFKLAI
jgi:predicted metal-dependent TIM-barrel fold hydrolase